MRNNNNAFPTQIFVLEMARREKISELLQATNVSSTEDIQELFRETIAQFMVQKSSKILHGKISLPSTLWPIVPMARCPMAATYSHSELDKQTGLALLVWFYGLMK